MSSSFAPPPAPQPPHLPPPPRPSGGLATGGFVVALVGAVLALIPILGIVSWVLSPLGLVLSLVGLNTIPRGQQGRGLGVAGAILGAVGLLICMSWASAFSNAMSSRSSTPSYSSFAPSSSSYPSYSAVAPTTTSSMPSVNGPFSSGTYLVGSEIAPGQYRTDGGSFCGWSRNEDTSGELDATIANGIVNGPSTITVRGSDGAIEFSGDCTWTRR
jgi:hypothetical protein